MRAPREGCCRPRAAAFNGCGRARPNRTRAVSAASAITGGVHGASREVIVQAWSVIASPGSASALALPSSDTSSNVASAPGRAIAATGGVSATHVAARQRPVAPHASSVEQPFTVDAPPEQPASAVTARTRENPIFEKLAILLPPSAVARTGIVVAAT
jgi:hypothetical protein